jgi:aspartate carbamoyltransferase catalytic subunit
MDRQEITALLAQADREGIASWRQRRHLLDTYWLGEPELSCLVAVAAAFKQDLDRPSACPALAGRTVASLFYENSTRTRSSFELAARRLGADVINLDTRTSSVTKGETIADTVRQLVSMRVAALVHRHGSSGSAHQLAARFHDDLHVINAGDGWHAHPTQALLDYFTMVEIHPSLAGLRIAIVGDIQHSRVARSNIDVLTRCGADVRVCAPPTLMPEGIEKLGVTVHTKLETAIAGAHFVKALRMQLERQQQGLIPSIGEYTRSFRIDREKLKLASPNVRLLHPGPVNRGIEVEDELVDDPDISLVARQVTNGVVVRMAVLYLLLNEETHQ